MGKSAAARAAAAEPTAAGAGSSERDVLLATKLNVPGLRPDLVPRPRLARRIAAQRGGSGFHAAASVPLGCLARLRSAFGAEPAAPYTAAVPGLVDPLTSRELEVLEMLAAGSSNQVIASQLVVTLDTVKKHVSHVPGKLGAANRTEAVARARELSLIRR
jgi:LuxR family transcriptional regulator, maltose regulon positive regulatory protein